MLNIEKLETEIVKKLKPLNPDKIILFGSYAYGTPNENSDIDLFLIKNDINEKNIRAERIKAQKQLWSIVAKEKIGFDIFVDSYDRVKNRIESVKDQFYADVMQKGKVIYAK